MTPIARHGDQAAVMQSVPFGIGARVEQELHRLQVSLSHGEMDRRRVPVFRAAESRVSFEQPPQRVDVAIVGRGECVPDDAALLGVELGRFDDRAARQRQRVTRRVLRNASHEAKPYSSAMVRCASRRRPSCG